jgi:hypothetical protein
MAVVAVAVACGIAGCASEQKIKSEDIPPFLVEKVSEQTRFTPTDITCPDDIDAKVGITFDCHFTGPQGRPYVAHLKIVKVDGDVASYEWSSEPVDGAAHETPAT